MTCSLSDCGFGELVWENGQILTRALSTAGSHETHRYWNGFPLHDSEAQVVLEEVGRETSMEKRGKLLWDNKEFPGFLHANMDPHHHDISPKKDCYTELFAKFSGSILNNEVVAYTSNSHDEQLVPSADHGSFKHGNARDQICNSSFQQWQSSPTPLGRPWEEEKQIGEPENRTSPTNFSYFLNIAALDDKAKKADIIDDARAKTRPGLSKLEKPKSTDCANELKPIPPPTGLGFGRNNANSTASDNHVHDQPNSSFAASIVKEKRRKSRAEKSEEPLVPSSSTCSLEASNCPSYSIRSKCQASEESELPSQSFEEEPRRAAGGSKRHRGSEGHSLSEKRRRDRINKKMRLLQELIPNCEKGDKISVLDEAIDYLKTLQLQVQVMSMGAAMCMPPLMMPAALQQIQAAQMPHFSPIGVGMGMGMGMGLGLGLGCSPNRFRNSHIFGAGPLAGIAGTAHQMLGQQGQVLPMPLSSAPFIPLQAGSLTQSVLVPSAPKDIRRPVESSSPSPSSSN